MTGQERNQILKMIADGKITPKEGLHLMQAIEQQISVEKNEETPAVIQAETPEPPNKAEAEPQQTVPSGFATDPRIEKVKSTVRRLWQIPLWIGILITVLSALGMYAVMRGPGMNFWFYFLLLPLFLGVAVIAAAVGSRQAHWIFVDVQQKPGEHPQRIFLGFPLPESLTIFLLRIFGPLIPNFGRTNINNVIQVIETGLSGSEPLIVNVDEGKEGERVRVFIG
jgi:hypothetical protein